MRRLAVLGKPVSHSLSPAIHGAAFRALGLEEEWSYGAIEVESEAFDDEVRELAATGYAGVNVTVPHKIAALEVAGEASSTATEIGAANTLSFDRGAIRADNTDAEGFVASLPEGSSPSTALVLGAGGAARAVVWALRHQGAAVSIWNRTRARAEELASEFGGEVAEPEEAGGLLAIGGYDVLVNTTTVGLQASREGGANLKALQIAADSFTERQIVVDLVYGSEETELLAAARARGATAVDGREVLVHQGAASFRIWTGLEPPIEAMREAARTG